MPSKSFVFLGQNTSAVWAFFLLFRLEHVAGLGPCKAEWQECWGEPVLGGSGVRTGWNCTSVLSVTEQPLLQHCCQLQPSLPWLSLCLGRVGFLNQEGYGKKTAGTDHPSFPGSRLCVAKPLLQHTKLETRSVLRAQTCAVKGRGSPTSRVYGKCFRRTSRQKSWWIFHWTDSLTWFFYPKFHQVPARLMLSCTI